MELEDIFSNYQKSFSKKEFSQEDSYTDILMDIFGISEEIKKDNMQYWSRELGMIWQKIVISFCRNLPDFKLPVKTGRDEIYDLQIGQDLIDTKYRIGSGDSGTLKKFKDYGMQIKDMGFTPVALILRYDNLPASMTALQSGGWSIYIGDEAFNYINNKIGIDLKKELIKYKDSYNINKS